MKTKEIIKRSRKLVQPFLVDKGKDFRLKAVDPNETLGYKNEDKPRANEALASPWHVVPADNKWFTRVVVAAAVVEALASVDLAYPAVGPEKLKELAAAKRVLVKK